MAEWPSAVRFDRRHALGRRPLGGVLDLFKLSFARQMPADGTYSGDKKDLIRALKCEYCKYNGDDPQTYFYAPYWFKSESGFYAQDARLAKPSLESRPVQVVGKDAVGKLSIWYDGCWVPNQAIIHHDAPSMVGIDFFTHGAIEATDGSRNSPRDVSTRLTTSNPLLLCIKSDSYCMKSDVLDLTAFSWKADNPKEPMLVRTASARSSKPPVMIVEGSTTNINQASIAAVVIWPSSTSKDPGRLTHYVAGDLGNEQEEYLIRWATIPDGSGNRAANKCAAMKLSHHAWEVVLFFQAWALYRRSVPASAGNPPPDPAVDDKRLFWPTNYPVYLGISAVTSGENYDMPGSLENLSTSNPTMFKSIIDALYKNVAGPMSGNPFDELINDKIFNPFSRAKWLVNRLVKDWESFCEANPESDSTGLALDRGILNANEQPTRAILIGQSSTTVAGKAIIRKGDVLKAPEKFPDPPRAFHSSKSKAVKAKPGEERRSKRVKIFYPAPGAKRVSIKDQRRFLKKRTRLRAQKDLKDSQFFPPAPAAGLAPPAPPTTEPVFPPSRFYFVSSLNNLPDMDSLPPDKVCHVDMSSTLDFFLSNLHTPVLVLSQQPHLPEAGRSDVSLAPEDPFKDWMLAIMSGTGTDVIVEADTTSVSAFKLKTTLGAAFSDFSPVSSAGLTTEVIFSSKDNPSAFNFDPPASGPVNLPPESTVEDPDPVELFLTADGKPGFPPGTDNGVVTVGGLLIMTLQPSGQILSTKFNAHNMRTIFEMDMDQEVSALFDVFEFTIDPAKGARNAIWFDPQDNFRTVLRLQFKLSPEFTQKVEQLFQKFVPSIKLPGQPIVVARKTWSWVQTQVDYTFAVDPEIIILADVVISDAKAKKDLPVEIAYVVQRTQTDVIVTFSDVDDQNKLDNLLTVLADELHCPVPQFGQYLPGVGDNIRVRRLTLTRKNRQPITAKIDIEILLSSVVPFHVTIDDTMVMGSLWLSHQSPEFAQILQPAPLMAYYEPFRFLTTKAPDPTKNTMTLTDLHMMAADKPLDTPPPQGIKAAEVFGITFMLDQRSILFQGLIACEPPDPKAAKVPTISLDEVDLMLQYDFSIHELTLVLGATVFLESEILNQQALKQNILPPIAKLGATVTYSGGSWVLTGTARNLSMELLYSLFDDDCNLEVMNMLSEVGIVMLDLQYTYDAEGNGNTFLVAGELELAGLTLDFRYEHQGKKQDSEGASSSNWTFRAQLKAGQHNSSLLDIIECICGKESGISGVVPNCLGKVSCDTSAEDLDFNPALSPVELEIVKLAADPAQPGSEGCFLFKLRMTVGKGLNVTFVQYQSARDTSAAGGNPNDKPSIKPVKRAIKLSVGSLPAAPSVPLVGSLAQPFDEMDFVWVHAPGDDGGFKRSEVKLVNQYLFDNPSTGLRFKDPYVTPDGAPASGFSEDNIVLRTGSHFIVIFNDKIVIDHTFNAGTTKKEESIKQEDLPAGVASMAVQQRPAIQSDSPASEGGSTKGPMKRTIGPLSISNLGLRFDNDQLYVLLDATVSLGAVEFSLLGFGLRFDLTDADLHHLERVHVEPIISGLGFGFNAPPLQITGIFKKKEDLYAGGASFAFDPYLFMAVGEYGTVTTKEPPQSFDCIFVFAQLDGPLVNLGFAEIMGIEVGFGHNTALVYPDLTTINQFPFCSTLQEAESQDPLELLGSFLAPKSGNPWVVLQEGPIWLAAGLEVLAFDVVDVSAIVIASFGPSMNLAIFADGVAQMPEAVPPNECFVYVEFGILATIDFSKGTMVIEASLSPNSFVLSPSCHLTGGFALCNWWAPSEHAGDYVYTVGGYHAAYKPPSHYPVPPRLGISWGIDSCLSVTGEAYFAVTPHVAMGGGQLSATFSAGPLSSYFRAWADFLINYSPFHFIGDVGVTVGVEFSLDLFFFTLHIGCSIGASLELAGPPFHGVVHVDFYVFGFDIHFGPDSDEPKGLSLDDFCDLLMRQSAPVPAAKPPDPNVFHVLTAESGLIPSQSDKMHTEENKPWNVRAGTFSFRVQSHHAVKTSVVNAGEKATHPDIYSKPMKLTDPIASDLQITIERTDDDKDDIGTFRQAPLKQPAPAAIWGQYPDLRGKQVGTLLSPAANIDVVMGVIVQVPKPQISTDTLQAFNAAEAAIMDIVTSVPDQPAQDSFLPAPSLHDVPAPTAPTARWGLKAPPATQPVDDSAWTAIRDVWGDRKVGRKRKLVIEAWSEAFGWDEELEDEPLEMLLGSFDDMYMAPPRMCAEFHATLSDLSV
ncbi:hypothetical protein H2199_009234 [Coniosporium tulheliwenetii]|uniref:Uncharacterized protein n=1 Tax=Coniosporium tulheliwenetii TaxID=3383036 RepID=A0ACC2YEM8_9PEZI|nr:hypothetical protein H2199_009234 [Cladosporium sp. JES 115]